MAILTSDPRTNYTPMQTSGMVVIAANPTDGKVLVRDSGGQLVWMPGSENQIQEAVGTTSRGEIYNQPYVAPGSPVVNVSGPLIERQSSNTDIVNRTPPPATPAEEAEYDEQVQAQQEALRKLEPYETSPGNYDIAQYMLDLKESPAATIQTLKAAGFTKETIREVAKGNLTEANAATLAVQQNYSASGVAKYTGNLVAEMVVPFYATVKHWDELSGWEKVVYPALDVAILIPVAGLAAKGVGITARSITTGAKVASIGGREAVQIAAKDAAAGLEKSLVKQSAQKALLESSLEAAKTTQGPVRKVYAQAAREAAKDLKITTKQITGLTKDVNKLQVLARQASKGETAGTKVFRATERIETATTRGRVARTMGHGSGYAISGITSYATIRDWGDLSPTQRAAGIAIAMLPVGGFGKAKNLVENIADPHKIPKKALVPRELPRRTTKVGAIFNPEGDNTLRLNISDAKKLKNLDYQQARAVAQDIMDQATSGKQLAKATLKGEEVKLKGTGFQKTVAAGGHVAISGTPTGEVFKEGTGSFGIKTNLEKYLEKVNQGRKTPIEIESKPYSARNPETGKLETIKTSTRSTPGVNIAGSEGGLYLGPGLHTRFVRQSAAGIKGGISSGVIVGYEDINKLPRSVATKALEDNQMRDAAIKYFDGAKGSGQVVEGFKKFGRIMELENVATNGTQLSRVRNLRSKMKIWQGEYYTRDSKGRIELFQMYVEGGRSTPYTMKELYLLKGHALKNALVDIGVGLKNRIAELRRQKPSPGMKDIMTKEEQILKSMADVDESVRAGRIKPEDALNLKRNAIDEIRFREAARSFSPAERTRFRAEPLVSRTNTSVIREDTRMQGDRLYRAEEAARQLQRSGTERNRVERAPARREAGRSEERPPRERPPRSEERPPRERPPRSEERPPRERPPREEERKPKETERPPGLDIQGDTEKQVRFPQGTVAWKQGIGWWVFSPPYNRPEDRRFLLKKPKGVIITADAKTAAGTIQSVGGPSPMDLKFDMGIVDVDLRNPPQKPSRPEGKKSIGFRRDRDQTYSGIHTRKVGPYYYRAGAVSRKPMA